ncbi:MAG: DUF2357 domain-containing protein [Ruminococcus sp.]|nr:DUF2357 domain-containing protein [Candidatus Apopatosoma intestinale]
MNGASDSKENIAGAERPLAQADSPLIRVKDLFENGKSTVELKKRYMLKAIDEVWVRAIEDTIPSLDVIIRHPGVFLQEREDILPIEQTRRVTGRSIQHLSQHTDFIKEIRDDGTVMPTKLLNVFQDETMLTYENRFINTLLANLYGFVSRRYDMAAECGEDEKMTRLTLDQTFGDDETHGTMTLTIEYSEKPRPHEVIKNYIYSDDLWKRVERIYKIVTTYMDSDFSRQLGKNYVHPPIIRTNKLLKNVDFRQCLSLWEFLEQYENTGYETLIQENLETVGEDCLDELYRSLADQYLIFQKHIRNEFVPEMTLDSHLTDEIIHPEIKSELDPLQIRELDYRDVVPAGAPEPVTETGEEPAIEEAIRVALAADSIFTAEEADGEEESVFEKKKIAYRYRYSYLSRLIRAQNPTQDYYTEIKNELLAYSDVSSRISWNHELFAIKRRKLARINVKGKTIFLYLPLNPQDFPVSKYHHKDVSDVKKHEDLPFLLRVRSDRGVKYAKELIALVMQSRDILRLETPTYTDYHMAYATNEELAARTPPLVKILPGSEDLRENEIPVPEIPAAPAIPAIPYRYRYSFSANLIRAQSPLQDYYETLKNELLSYEKVRSTMSWNHESFRHGRGTLVRLKGRGKTLQVLLKLDPATVPEKYHVKSGKGDFSSVLRVRSARGVGYAKALIARVMTEAGIAQNEVPKQSYRMPFMTNEEMLALPTPLVKNVKAPAKK